MVTQRRTEAFNAPGNLSPKTWDLIQQWISAQGHKVDFSEVYDWKHDIKGALASDGTRLQALVEELATDTEFEPRFADLALDLQILPPSAQGPDSAQKAFLDLANNPKANWATLERRARGLGWTFGDDDVSPPADEPEDPTHSRLLAEVHDMADRIQGMLESVDDEMAVEILRDIELPSEDDIAAAADDIDALTEIVRKQKSILVRLSKLIPVSPDSGEDVPMLPPGTAVQPSSTPAPHDKRPDSTKTTSEIPSKNDAVPAIGMEDPQESGGSDETAKTQKDPEDALDDVASRVNVKSGGKIIDVGLPNDIEFTLKRTGRKPDYLWDVTVDNWLDDDELAQFLLALGGELTKKQDRLKAGFGKSWLRFKKDGANWDITVDTAISMVDAAKLIQHFAHINTGATGGASPEDERDFDLLEGISFADEKPVADVDAPVGDTVYYTVDEWHDTLINLLEMQQENRVRYKRVVDGGNPIVVKLEKPKGDDFFGGDEYKQAVLLVNNKPVGTFINPDELLEKIDDYLPQVAADADPGHDEVEIDTGDTVSADVTVIKDIYILGWDGIDFLALDGDEADTPWLVQSGFVWHPGLWKYHFSDKARGLRMLDLLKAGKIEILNEGDAKRVIGSQRLPRKLFPEILKEQKGERRKQPQDMGFSVHVSHDVDNNRVMICTQRGNNKNADRIFRKHRWEYEGSGYWCPIKDRTQAVKILKALHTKGLRLGDSEDFEDRWKSAYGGKPPVDFAAGG